MKVGGEKKYKMLKNKKLKKIQKITKKSKQMKPKKIIFFIFIFILCHIKLTENAHKNITKVKNRPCRKFTKYPEKYKKIFFLIKVVACTVHKQMEPSNRTVGTPQTHQIVRSGQQSLQFNFRPSVTHFCYDVLLIFNG